MKSDMHELLSQRIESQTSIEILTQ